MPGPSQPSIQPQVQPQTQPFSVGPDASSRRGESLLKVITDNLPIGIAYVGPNRTYRFANPRFANAYGLSTEGIIGMRADEFICSDAMELGDPFFQAAYRGTAVDFLHPARHADGREMTVRTFLRPDISDDGIVLGFFVCSFNVTREREAEAKLVQAQKMDAVGQLASGMAHDFNNLLGVVLGTLEGLQDRIDDPELTENYLDPARHAVAQGAQLTKQLLVIARQQPVKPAAIEIHSTLDTFLRLLGPSIRSDITVCARCHGEIPDLFLDAVQFEVALLNLCLNARDAMPAGGRLGIDIVYPSPQAGTDFARMTVSDTGCGIEEGMLKDIFEPFFTTKGIEKGTGLGLSMVAGFVQQSGARIEVESRPGLGTQFHLDLPIAQEAGVESGNALAQQTPEAAAKGLILLVDDAHDLRRGIRRDLAKAGYTVIEAESTEEALPLIEAIDDLSAVVSDVVMGGLSGIDLAQRVNELRPDLRVILMTGGDTEAVIQKLRQGIPVMKKPFATRQLVKLLQSPPQPLRAKEI